jgi:UPF0755 protein
VRRFLLLAALAAAGAVYFFYRETEEPRRPVGAAPVVVDVQPGRGADAIAREMHRLGLVSHPLVFKLYVWRRGSAGRLRAGQYTVPGGKSLRDVVERMERGDADRRALTFPEGYAIDDMAALLPAVGVSAEAFRAAAAETQLIKDLDPTAKDLEGYLFPDTYDVGRDAGAAKTLVARMVQRFKSVIKPELPKLQASGLTLRQLVTLASLVELETARAEERPRIAAVFRNRMRKGMLLQTDPTVIYALKKAGPYDGNIHKKDLDIDSPYNTYKYAGLPPGPIASPGRGALHAVLEPLDVKDLYFVSRNDGTHEFNETLKQHELAVNRYQRYRERRASPSAAPSSRSQSSPAPQR